MRVSATGEFGDSEYKVLSRDFDVTQPLLPQLQDLSYLEGRGFGDDSVPPEWLYAEPARRIQEWLSVNSGDIVLLANGSARFQFAEAYRANHGSLTAKDGVVPVAFGYLGARTTEPGADTTLDVFRELFGSLHDGHGTSPLTGIAESAALDRFFGVEAAAAPGE